MTRNASERLGRVVELFAGVGGFRLGLEGGAGHRSGAWRVVWSNQWEPSTKRQHASDCYVHRFGPEGHSNGDIAAEMDRMEAGDLDLPDHDLLVGGFPCQDYSVARTLSQAIGIRGRKGVLWWQIVRLVEAKRPPLLLLENVDRLLKSPAHQRGRDFAVMLAALDELGYAAEWRVVNAADYGFPQRRRRVFIVGHHLERTGLSIADESGWILGDGPLARALPVRVDEGRLSLGDAPFPLEGDLADISGSFGEGDKMTRFRNAGLMVRSKVWTRDVASSFDGPRWTLGDVLQPHDEVEERFFIPAAQVAAWSYLKGAKREPRVHRASGAEYFYSEGAIPFPDPVDRPSRTILTGEGGSSPSRFKHLVEATDGRYRRLTPVELERLNGFPDGWTDTGMSDARRAFTMGNALVVGLVSRIGAQLARSDPSKGELVDLPESPAI